MMLPILAILFLVTSLGSVLLYQRTDNEIYKILAIATAIVCIVWGLVVAHWSIHIFALLALLLIKKPSLNYLFSKQ